MNLEEYYEDKFPATREVDRYLYGDERRPDQISCAEQFPAPREVDRDLYERWSCSLCGDL